MNTYVNVCEGTYNFLTRGYVVIPINNISINVQYLINNRKWGHHNQHK